MVCWKCNASGNPIGISNKNPLLEKHLYEVEFPGREATELVATIIAELRYTQCNIDWNEYLLLESFANHRKNDSALNVDDQKEVV